MARTRVLIIDDSALIRQLLTEILGSDPGLEVVGVASDPYVAWEKIKKLRPDVLTLDVEMPRMDGLTFLQKLMQIQPLPVLMVSSLTEKGCETTFKALELGAVDFVTKPKVDVRSGTVELAHEIIEKVKVAASAKLRGPRRKLARPVSTGPAKPPTAKVQPSGNALLNSTQQIVCIGASTGGTEAILQVLTSFPADAPGTVIVQHMPPGFTRSFAARLDASCRIRVHEARDGDRILPGHALLAPGGLHMAVRRSGACYSVKVGMGQPVNRHRPSVDVLFRSAARYLGSNAVGVILTGMGDDGAAGLLEMQSAGARTIAQNEDTCVVFGMPKEAISRGAAGRILPLDSIASAALALSDKPAVRC